MPKQILIGLTGFKQSGKDSTAEHLVKMFGFEQRAFAAKMKQAVANLFDITVEQVDEFKVQKTVGRYPIESEIPYAEVILEFETTQVSWTWREFLQRFGTEMARHTFGEHFWVNLLMCEPFYTHTVISDCRFINEMRAVKENGGQIVQVVRPGYESDGHASEDAPPSHLVDYVLHNDGDKGDLFLAVEKMLYDLYHIEPEVG